MLAEQIRLEASIEREATAARLRVSAKLTQEKPKRALGNLVV